MIDYIVAQRLDHEMLKTQFGNMVRVGPVEVIDAQKGYRIKIGDGDDGPVLSPWYPHPESGGQSASWMPLSKGQVVAMFHPHGDARQGVLIRGGFTHQNAPPSQDLESNVLKAFGITMAMKDGLVTIEGNVQIDGDLLVNGQVDLGGEGGERVARIGDMVEVQTGSSAGLHPIVEGSSSVRAID